MLSSQFYLLVLPRVSSTLLDKFPHLEEAPRLSPTAPLRLCPSMLPCVAKSYPDRWRTQTGPGTNLSPAVSDLECITLGLWLLASDEM